MPGLAENIYRTDTVAWIYNRSIMAGAVNIPSEVELDSQDASAFLIARTDAGV
jgi:hypothetical protein